MADGVVAVSMRVLSGLLVPADPGRPLAVCTLVDSAAAISDLLGGVLLDDPLTWRVGEGVFAAVYWAEDRAGLPVNQRLSVAAARMGIIDRVVHAAAARGDALILGTRAGCDVNVPAAVVAAVHQCDYPVATGAAAPVRPTS